MIFCDGKTCPVGWWHYSCAELGKDPEEDILYFLMSCQTSVCNMNLVRFM